MHVCYVCVCVHYVCMYVCSEDECDHANSVTSNVRCGLWEVGVEDEGMVNVRCGR